MMKCFETIDLVDYTGGVENEDGSITVTSVDTIASLPLKEYREIEEHMNIQHVMDKHNDPFICYGTLYIPIEYEIFRDFNEFEEGELGDGFDEFINVCELNEVGTSCFVCYTVTFIDDE